MERHVFDLTGVALDFINADAVRSNDAQALASLPQADRLAVQNVVDRVFDYLPTPSDGQTKRYNFIHKSLGSESLSPIFVQYITNEPTTRRRRGISFIGPSGESTSSMHRKHRK